MGPSSLCLLFIFWRSLFGGGGFNITGKGRQGGLGQGSGGEFGGLGISGGVFVWFRFCSSPLILARYIALELVEYAEPASVLFP